MRNNWIIPDIASLRETVRISSTMPYESVLPFIDAAVETYLLRQVGAAFLTAAETAKDPRLLPLIRAAVGPLAMALGTHELGVFFGDSGLTVDNVQGKRSPANEAKIAAARKNLMLRGTFALDRLLQFLSEEASSYPEYESHRRAFYGTPCFVPSPDHIELIGMVDIGHSTLCFRAMLPAMLQLQERVIRPLITDELCERLLDETHTDTPEEVRLRAAIICYLSNKAACIYERTLRRRAEEQNDGGYDLLPPIRPMGSDVDDACEYYTRSADYYEKRIAWVMGKYAEELGVDTPRTAARFNEKKKHLFTSIS